MKNNMCPYSALLSFFLALYMGLWPLSAGSGYGLSQILNFLLLFVVIILLVLAIVTRKLVSIKLNMSLCMFVIAPMIIASIYVVSSFKNGFDLISLAKAALWLTPLLIVVALWNVGINKSLMIKVWFGVGLISNIIITFFIASFDPAVGKFYALLPGFEISSNTLSVYLVFSVVIPAVFLFKSTSALRLYLIMPFIHFSKSHVAIYIVSVIFGSCFSKRRMFLLLCAGALLIFILILVGANADEIRIFIPVYLVKSVGKLVIACEIVYNFFVLGELPVFSVFISQVGDGLRASIYNAALSNLEVAWPLGATPEEIDQIFSGYDFHNMFFFFYYQTGIAGLLLYLAIIFAPLHIANKADKRIRFLVGFSCSYLLARGLFISIDPVRTSVLLATLSYMSCLRSVRQ